MSSPQRSPLLPTFTPTSSSPFLYSSIHKLSADNNYYCLPSPSTFIPATSVFNSSKDVVVTRAFGFPMDSRVRKKLFPASSPLTFEASTIVKEETPGNIKFFKISVPVAEALIKQTLLIISSKLVHKQSNQEHVAQTRSQLTHTICRNTQSRTTVTDTMRHTVASQPQYLARSNADWP